MKVITLKQPWATLVAEGYKKFEFRTWSTKYKGELYIHAGKGIDKEALKKFEHLNLDYPKSKIIAKVNLIECIELTPKINKDIIKQNPLVYSNKVNREGYAWKIELIKKITCEKTVNGQLGIWNLDI